MKYSAVHITKPKHPLFAFWSIFRVSLLATALRGGNESREGNSRFSRSAVLMIATSSAPALFPDKKHFENSPFHFAFQFRQLIIEAITSLAYTRVFLKGNSSVKHRKYDDDDLRLHSLEMVTQHSHFTLILIHSQWLYYSEHLNVVEGAPYSEDEKNAIQFCKWKNGIDGFWYVVNDLEHLLNDFTKNADTLKFALHTNCIIYELKRLLALFAWVHLGFESRKRQTRYFLFAPISQIAGCLADHTVRSTRRFFQESSDVVFCMYCVCLSCNFLRYWPPASIFLKGRVVLSKIAETRRTKVDWKFIR